MSENRFSRFITGALVGIGLGLLIAPQEGNETRQKLKSSLNELLDSVKEIDIEETKIIFMQKLRSIKDDLNDLTTDAKLKIIKDRIKHIKTTCEELETVANDTSSYKVAQAANMVEQKANDILEQLNTSNPKKTKASSKPKKKLTNSSNKETIKSKNNRKNTPKKKTSSKK